MYQKNYKVLNRERLNAQAAKRKRERYAGDPEFREKMKAGIRALSGDPHFREYMKAYISRKRMENPFLKIRDNLSRRIRSALKGRQKLADTESLLGCTLDQFRAHLESLFIEGMSWENYGYYGWHLDHIQPCSSFKLEDPEQQKLCFHYTNLQPLWREENQSKSDKVLELEAEIVAEELDDGDPDDVI